MNKNNEIDANSCLFVQKYTFLQKDQYNKQHIASFIRFRQNL